MLVNRKKILIPILFILCTATLAERFLHELHREKLHLREQLVQIQELIRVETLKHNELLAESKSQSDPEWIELILIRELGLVPEGYKKVLFTQ